MSNFLAKICLAAALVAPMTLTAETGEGRRLADQAFDHIVKSGAGFMDQGQFLNAGRDVFAAMDYEDDGIINLGEFLVFDFGMRGVAEQAGREDALETGLRVVFAFWDRDGDGNLSVSEHQRALSMDFQRADDNGDARLSKEEFMDGFTVLVAARAAINPTPVE